MIADSFTLEVAVGPAEMFTVPETVYVYGNAGEFADTNFYVHNIGNKTIDRIELFPMTDLYAKTNVRIAKENIQFTPPIIIDSIRVNESTAVTVRIEIPRAALPTMYFARAKAMQQRGEPAKNFVIALNVIYQTDISEGEIVSDNPVTGSYVDIACIGDPGTKPKLTIMNMAAEIVITGELTIPKYGEAISTGTDYFYHWDLKNAHGKDVASGLYVAIIETKVGGKDKVFTKKILIVR
jgi:hypothetical protein